MHRLPTAASILLVTHTLRVRDRCGASRVRTEVLPDTAEQSAKDVPLLMDTEMALEPDPPTNMAPASCDEA